MKISVLKSRYFISFFPEGRGSWEWLTWRTRRLCERTSVTGDILVKLQTLHLQFHWERILWLDVFLGFVHYCPGDIYSRASINDSFWHPHWQLFSNLFWNVHCLGCTYVWVCHCVFLCLGNTLICEYSLRDLHLPER